MAEIKGLRPGELEWQPDFEASVDSKGKWEGSISFICFLRDVTRLIPLKSAPCVEDGFSFLGLDSAKVENYEGELARVLCRYVGSTQVGPDPQDDDTNRTELAISTGEEPIESHPNYKDLEEADLVNIQHLKAGRLKPTGTEGEYVLKTDEKNAKKITFEDSAAAELVAKISSGITSYLAANQIYRITYTSRNSLGSSVLNRVGKIVSPSGAPSIGGSRNWLFVGASQSQEGSSYSISLEYRLSGLGGWDTDIYD